MNSLTIYKCENCDNLLCMIENSGIVPVCCGKPMKLVEPNNKDFFFDKHVPVISRNSNEVTVAIGESEHPMTKDHYIMWIAMITDKGVYGRKISPMGKPVATFYVGPDEEVLCAYAYCNLHGLWKKSSGRYTRP